MSESFFDFRHLVSGPYDSPMEEWFLHHLVKYLAPDATYQDHVPFQTMCGPFVVDYVVRVGSRAVGFEVDGREFHQDEIRDEYRDAAILEAGELDTIYRFRAGDLYRYPEDCLFAVARADPELMSERGRRNLERLAHRDVKQTDIGPDSSSIHLWVHPAEDDSSDDGPLDNELVDDDAHLELHELREERALDRIVLDRRVPYTILIRRRRPVRSFANTISVIRKFGPGPLDEVRRRGVEYMRASHESEW